MKRSELSSGTKVTYLGDIPAEVVSVAANGITVGFWGQGLKRDQWVQRRVSLLDLTPRAPCPSAPTATR